MTNDISKWSNKKLSNELATSLHTIELAELNYHLRMEKRMAKVWNLLEELGKRLDAADSQEKHGP